MKQCLLLEPWWREEVVLRCLAPFSRVRVVLGRCQEPSTRLCSGSATPALVEPPAAQTTPNHFPDTSREYTVDQAMGEERCFNF